MRSCSTFSRLITDLRFLYRALLPLVVVEERERMGRIDIGELFPPLIDGPIFTERLVDSSGSIPTPKHCIGVKATLEASLGKE